MIHQLIYLFSMEWRIEHAGRAKREGQRAPARHRGTHITATTNELLHVLDSHSITTLHITQSYYRVPTHKSIHLSLSLHGSPQAPHADNNNKPPCRLPAICKAAALYLKKKTAFGFQEITFILHVNEFALYHPIT
jgi:hypothetical protein